MSFVLIGTPPRPEVSQQLSVVKEGQNLTITCSVSSGELHSLAWFKDKEPVPKKHVLTLGSHSELRINNVSKSDAGNYECRAMDFGAGYWLKTATVKIDGTYLP